MKSAARACPICSEKPNSAPHAILGMRRCLLIVMQCRVVLITSTLCSVLHDLFWNRRLEVATWRLLTWCAVPLTLSQIWIILYGQIQSWSPQMVLRPLGQEPPNKLVAVLWAALLVACPAIMAGVLLGSDVYGPGVDRGRAVIVLTVVLYIFCIVFAVNSAVHRCTLGGKPDVSQQGKPSRAKHTRLKWLPDIDKPVWRIGSYLVVRYSEGDKVAMNVGFYYMANAGGRLLGAHA